MFDTNGFQNKDARLTGRFHSLRFILRQSLSDQRLNPVE